MRSFRKSAWIRPARLALLAVGLVTLGYSGLTVIEAHLYQIYEGRAFDLALSKSEHRRARPSTSTVSSKQMPSSAPLYAALPLDHKAVARLEIPRIGLDTLVLEGANGSALRLGAGHIPGTAFPGEAGNVGIAGHRDTFFRSLRNIRRDDEITLRTPQGTYGYVVESMSIVDPDQVQVLRPTVENALTLVTCFPFDFVGSAPKRFIVRARQAPISSP